jgi:pilus assembly protein CpaB
MRRGRVFFLLALILIGIALAAFLFLRGIGPTTTGGEPEATPMVRDANIVIAAQDIPRGAKIPADAVLVSKIPSDMVVETMARDIGEVVGRRARMDIARGIPITTNMVTDQAGDVLGTGSDASLAIPPGFTAIAVPMSRLSGVAYALRDGDSVDVLVSILIVDIDAEFQSILPNLSSVLAGPDGVLTSFVVDSFDPQSGNVQATEPRPVGRVETDVSTGELLYLRASEEQRPRLVTQRLIENATVLHVGTFAFEDEVLTTELVPTEGEGQGEEGAQVTRVRRPPDVITLIVSPQDALALNYAMKSGAVDITLTLRGPDDATQFETSSVSLQYLLDNYGISIPTKLPYGLEPRLDKIAPPTLPNDQAPEPAQ